MRGPTSLWQAKDAILGGVARPRTDLPETFEEASVKHTRALLTTILPAALVATMALTGCAGSNTSSGDRTNSGGAVKSAILKDANGKDCVASGPASDAISVSGTGANLKLTSKTPVESKKLERSVLAEGETQPFADGVVPQVTYTIFNGKTGKVINSKEAAQIPNKAEGLDPVFYDAVRCAAPGQRAAIVVPVGVALGGADPKDAGLTDLSKTDSLVLVFDFAKPFEEFADCKNIEPRNAKFPEVDLGDGKSEPKITIPKCMKAPDKLELKVLKQGTGAVVKANQDIMTNYVGVSWNGAERFDGNWSKDGIKFSTAQGALIEGFTQAMVGQKIGSTILVTIPPKLGYNDGMTRTFVLQLVSAA